MVEIGYASYGGLENTITFDRRDYHRAKPTTIVNRLITHGFLVLIVFN